RGLVEASTSMRHTHSEPQLCADHSDVARSYASAVTPDITSSAAAAVVGVVVVVAEAAGAVRADANGGISVVTGRHSLAENSTIESSASPTATSAEPTTHMVLMRAGRSCHRPTMADECGSIRSSLEVDPSHTQPPQASMQCSGGPDWRNE